MKYLRLLVITMAGCLVQSAYAQKFHYGIFGGAAGYTGDLENRVFPKNSTNAAIGISGTYYLGGQLAFRSGLTYCVIGGADRNSEDASRVTRNLSFETKLTEFSFIGELYLLNLDKFPFSPYVFGGASVYKYNPYAHDSKGDKVYLKPLSTEGQGLSAYPDRVPYQLLQCAIPYGGGIKFVINNKVRVGFEFGFRKLFTEYLDDVSNKYVRWQDLLASRGPVSVEMSFRGDELNIGSANSSIPYPPEGTQRGDPEKKDSYYFSGIHLTYRFISEERQQRDKYKAKLNCPPLFY